jgi:hypothetical protein
VPDLVLSDKSTSIWPVSIIVGSVLVAISMQSHHAMSSERWDGVITDFTQRERIDVVVSDARLDLEHGVRVVIDHVTAIGHSGFARI